MNLEGTEECRMERWGGENREDIFEEDPGLREIGKLAEGGVELRLEEVELLHAIAI